jgi:tRNA/rRNA methyltransferase
VEASFGFGHGLGLFRLVLVEPRVAGNVGACARVAANFECPDWILVNPLCDPRSAEALKLARGSSDRLLRRVKTVPSLPLALRGCHAAVGFTRRTGHDRKPSIRLEELLTLGRDRGKTALVFGNEETGLTTSELASCTHLCAIPTSPELGSMNLSHAVAVVLAAVFASRQRRAPAKEKGPEAAPLEEREALLGHLRELLLDIGLDSAGNPERLLAALRRRLDRCPPTLREIRAVRAILSKTQVRLGTRSRGRRTV